MSDFHKAATLDEVPPCQGKVVEISGQLIALFNVGGSIHATDNACLHRGGPLGEGFLEGKEVTCPWHGWRFDVTTGVCDLRDDFKVATYPVKVEGKEIYVELGE